MGQRAHQAVQAGSTRLTGVCCNMTSLIRTAHGLMSGFLHGRSLAWMAYQPMAASAMLVSVMSAMVRVDQSHQGVAELAGQNVGLAECTRD